MLNTGDADADISITLYFEDAEPRGGFKAICPARRTHHIRLDKLKDAAGEHIPMGVPYAIALSSSAPVYAQYSRLDTTQSKMSLMTTIAAR